MKRKKKEPHCRMDDGQNKKFMQQDGTFARPADNTLINPQAEYKQSLRKEYWDGRL